MRASSLAALLLVGARSACSATPPATHGTLAGVSIPTGVEAPIRGFAREFIGSRAIPDATVVVLETGQTYRTDKDGRYSFTYPIGARLTLQLQKPGYEPTQADTVTVPAGGLTGAHDDITFQALLVSEYEIFQAIIGARAEPGMCHVATTLAALGKTMDDDLQGEPGARLVLAPAVTEAVFYFGVFKVLGPLDNKTDPFIRNLGTSSVDGGAVVFNLPPRDELYTLSAEKAGVRFSEAKVWCRPGSFVNVSPPRGPTVVGAPGGAEGQPSLSGSSSSSLATRLWTENSTASKGSARTRSSPLATTTRR